ncbi:MAG: hypothetical protein VW493_08540, partial [Gammaproteobacteria bacterium]
MLNSEVSFAMQRLPDWSGFGSALDHARLSGDTWAPFLPSHFGVLKALGIDPPERALFVGWQEIWSPKTLSGQGVEVIVCEAREDLRDAFKILTPNILVCEAIQDCSPLSAWISESSAGETAVFIGPAVALCGGVESLLKELVESASESIRIVKSSGRHIAGEWDAHKEIEAFEQLGLVEIDQVLSFPSIEVPNLIIKRDFLDGDYEGWRHVRAYIDEEGLPLRGTRSTCSRTWRQVLAAQSGPWDQCEGMRVFRFVGSPGAKSTVDFIYSSIGGRIPAVWTHVIKDSDSTVVYRESVLSQPDQKPANVSTEGPFIEHIFGKEPYLRQTVLSEVWLDKLRRHPGLDEFCSSLIRYLHFLKESVDGQTSVNFDLIPDNLVINSDGNIGVFDHEWGVS